MQTNRRDPLFEPAPSGRRWVVQGYMIFRPNSNFNPPTDVIELDDRVLVVIEIAGMRSSDISVTLNDRRLLITGTRERPSLSVAAYHQVEIGYGDFRVEVVLPWAVEPEDIHAVYREGFLQVELPRRAETQIHVVDVEQEERNPNE